MNLRQRRGVMFLAGSALFLLVGGSTLAGYVSDVSAEVGPKIEVVVLNTDLDVFTPLSEQDLDLREVPERWAPEGAVTAPGQVTGMVSTTELQAGTYVTEDLFGPPPELGPGEREIAILIDAETGVAGKVQTGSRVDIVATFAGDGAGRSEIIVADAQVLGIGDTQSDSDEAGFQIGQVVPITFALSVEDALILTHAESFAQRVRLALISPADDEPLSSDERVYPTSNEADAPDDTSVDFDETIGDDE